LKAGFKKLLIYLVVNGFADFLQNNWGTDGKPEVIFRLSTLSAEAIDKMHYRFSKRQNKKLRGKLDVIFGPKDISMPEIACFIKFALEDLQENMGDTFYPDALASAMVPVWEAVNARPDVYQIDMDAQAFYKSWVK